MRRLPRSQSVMRVLRVCRVQIPSRHKCDELEESDTAAVSSCIRSCTEGRRTGGRIRCKKRFLTFFGHVFTFLRLLFSERFLLKNAGKVQSGKQINLKHFQNNSNEIDQWVHK